MKLVCWVVVQESHLEPAVRNSANDSSAFTLQQTVNWSDCERQCVKSTDVSADNIHSAVLQSNCQVNVAQQCMSRGLCTSMPVRPIDDGRRPCFQVHAAGALMGNRLPDCAVARVSTTSEHQQQSVSALMDNRSFRDCSQWSPPAQTNSPLRQHSDHTDWSVRPQLSPSCDVNRPLWAAQTPPAPVSGINSHHRYASNVFARASTVYAPQSCGQMPNQFVHANVAAARLHSVSIPAVGIPRMWMQLSPRQQQQQHVAVAACQNSVSISPVQSAAVVVCAGQSNMSPTVWQPSQFVSQSFSSTRLPAVAVAAQTTAAVSAPQSECPSTLSQAQSCRITATSCSPPAVSITNRSAMRNNTVGRIYQLPEVTSVVTTMQHQCGTCVQSPVSACTSPSTTVSSSKSEVTLKKPVVTVRPVTKAVITPSQPERQCEHERTYMAGHRYTVRKEDGVTVEGIWDGKYLTVLTTTAANSTASQTPGQFLW